METTKELPPKVLADLYTISPAARMIGIDPQRLRYLTNIGKAVCVRDPLSTYRYYSLEEINRLRGLFGKPPIEEEAT